MISQILQNNDICDTSVSMNLESSLEDDILLNEIAHFETFFKNIGLKRVDGRVYGLLVLNQDALSSDEIETKLGLSQAAISGSLKNLTNWGAVISSYSSQRRCFLHRAEEDSLAIVATVFKKREFEFISHFKKSIQKMVSTLKQRGINSDDPRMSRLESILITSQMAEAVIQFVIKAASLGQMNIYSSMAKRLPQTLEVLIQGTKLTRPLAEKIKEKFLYH